MPAFLKLGDIKGEEKDLNHRDWIILESMTAPVARPVPDGVGDAGRAQGQTVLGDVRVTRRVDKSTAFLAEACARGRQFPDAEIRMCVNYDGKAQPYFSISLRRVLVTSFVIRATANGDPTPSDELTLTYTGIEWRYWPLDRKTGVYLQPMTTFYNFGDLEAESQPEPKAQSKRPRNRKSR